MKKIILILFVILFVTAASFAGNEYMQYKNTTYFQEHKKELTHKEKFRDDDGNTGANFTYDATPYAKFLPITSMIYLFLPVVVTILLSTYNIKQNPTRAGKRTSFLLFVFLTLLTVLLQQYNFLDPHLGWDERMIGVVFLGGDCLLMLALGMLSTSTAYWIFKKPMPKSTPAS